MCLVLPGHAHTASMNGTKHTYKTNPPMTHANSLALTLRRDDDNGKAYIGEKIVEAQQKREAREKIKEHDY